MPLLVHFLVDLSFELLSVGPHVNFLSWTELFHFLFVSCDDYSTCIIHIDETISVKITLLNLFLVESSHALQNDVDQLHIEGRSKDRVEAILSDPEVLFRLEILKRRLVDHTEELVYLLDEVVSEEWLVEANSCQCNTSHKGSS